MKFARFPHNLVATATSTNLLLSKMNWLDWLTSKIPFSSDHLVTISDINPITAVLVPKLVAMVTSLLSLTHQSIPVEFADSRNPISEPNRLSPTTEVTPILYDFSSFFAKFGCHGNVL